MCSLAQLCGLGLLRVFTSPNSTLKIQVTLDIVSRRLVNRYRRFEGIRLLSPSGSSSSWRVDCWTVKAMASRSSETSVSVYPSMWDNIRENVTVYRHCCENVKSRSGNLLRNSISYPASLSYAWTNCWSFLYSNFVGSHDVTFDLSAIQHTKEII